ncbi:MAG: adenylate/guanylate cyclase domain-containing protein [Pseudomonadota bacterium]
MLNTIRLKILAVAVALLAVFAATTGFSTYLVKQVVEEMDAITVYHIPVGAHVANLDVMSSELELHLWRGLAHAPLDGPHVAALRKRYSEVADTLRNDLKRAEDALTAAIADPRNDVDDRIALARLQGSFVFITNRLVPFIQAGNTVLDVLEAGDVPRAHAAMVNFGQYEDVFGGEIANMRKTLDGLTLASVTETNQNQLRVLRLNGILFLLATITGLGFFLVLTRRLQNSLTELLAGTKRVETGSLDVALRITSRDEIGRLTIAFNTMVGRLRANERIKDTFGKYLDPRIVSKLIEAQGDNATLSERRPATLFFSDIKGFSGMSESLTASAMVNLLNSYFSAVTKEIRDKQGIIDKFIGDAVMAFWTAPFSNGDQHAADACLAALAQQEAIAAFRLELPQITGLRRDAPDFAVRMGLATGEVVIGTIGSDVTKSYTVIGDVVNIASRLEGINKAYGTHIIIEENTYRFAQDVIEVRELDLLTVAGKSEPIRVYELVCRSGERTPELAELHEIFAAGLAAYRAQNWQTAEIRFAECLTRKADDGPSRVFQHRIQVLRATPPPPQWDGVWRHTEK